MIELRKTNHMSQSEMAEKLGRDKSSLSKAEKGRTSYENLRLYAREYCTALGYTEEQKKAFLRGTRAVVTDTSALLSRGQLIEDLSEEYHTVIVPRVVLEELDHIKDKNRHGLGKKAWQILRSISSKTNENVLIRDDTGADQKAKNDNRVLDIAVKASKEFHCPVDLISCDTGFAARLRGTDHAVIAISPEEYLATKQRLFDMRALQKVNEYYADSYDHIETECGISLPKDENFFNAYLSDGNTLIISAVRRKDKPTAQRIEKIRWLIEHGADVNKRDSGRYNFPPLSHVIQNNDRFPEHDLEIFRFLLNDCDADPNVGSRNPYDSGKIRQKNGGNMPLMIAAWHNKPAFVRELCDDKRTSLNQQDGNGFTALIKACGNGFFECRDILTAAGADTKIVDRDGKTADDRYREYHETGIRLNKNYDEKKNNSRKRKRNGSYGKRGTKA